MEQVARLLVRENPKVVTEQVRYWIGLYELKLIQRVSHPKVEVWSSENSLLTLRAISDQATELSLLVFRRSKEHRWGYWIYPDQSARTAWNACGGLFQEYGQIKEFSPLADKKPVCESNLFDQLTAPLSQSEWRVHRMDEMIGSLGLIWHGIPPQQQDSITAYVTGFADRDWEQIAEVEAQQDGTIEQAVAWYLERIEGPQPGEKLDPLSGDTSGNGRNHPPVTSGFPEAIPDTEKLNRHPNGEVNATPAAQETERAPDVDILNKPQGKRGKRSRYSQKERDACVKKWEALNREDTGMLLVDFLVKAFGQNDETFKPHVSPSAFYKWRADFYQRNPRWRPLPPDQTPSRRKSK